MLTLRKSAPMLVLSWSKYSSLVLNSPPLTWDMGCHLVPAENTSWYYVSKSVPVIATDIVWLTDQYRKLVGMKPVQIGSSQLVLISVFLIVLCTQGHIWLYASLLPLELRLNPIYSYSLVPSIYYSSRLLIFSLKKWFWRDMVKEKLLSSSLFSCQNSINVAW